MSLFPYPEHWVCLPCLTSVDFYFATLVLGLWIHVAKWFYRKEAVIFLSNLVGPYLDVNLI